MAATNWSVWTVMLVVGMLLTGTLNTLTKKIQNQAVSVGADGTDHKFHHPWFQTWVMFAGESLCLIAFFIMKSRERKQWSADEQRNLLSQIEGNSDLNADQEEVEPPNACSPIFFLPTLCDLAGTTFGGIGLLYTSASVWQMLRGSVTVFSGILSVIFLKRKLRIHHWTGMFVLCLGLSVVGVSNLLSTPAGDTSSMWIGIVFIVLGQLASAVQMVVEEVFIKKRKYAPLNVVGMEGISGFTLMGIVVLPALYFVPNEGVLGSNFHDDSLDAIVQITNNGVLLAMTLLYLCSIAFYNFFGLSVTKHLSAVHRTLIDACRTVIVWGTELVIFYFISEPFGEGWNQPWSLLQLGGFVLLIFGTLIYNETLKIVPCSDYSPPPETR